MRLASYVPGELIPLPLSGSIPELPHVAKVENRTTLKISRSCSLDFSAAASPFNATADARDRFWIKRYGPSRRCAQNASAALRIFVRRPKKTFATIPATNGNPQARMSTFMLALWMAAVPALFHKAG